VCVCVYVLYTHTHTHTHTNICIYIYIYIYIGRTGVEVVSIDAHESTGAEKLLEVKAQGEVIVVPDGIAQVDVCVFLCVFVCVICMCAC
jgi:hypothetical protein